MTEMVPLPGHEFSSHRYATCDDASYLLGRLLCLAHAAGWIADGEAGVQLPNDLYDGRHPINSTSIGQLRGALLVHLDRLEGLDFGHRAKNALLDIVGRKVNLVVTTSRDDYIFLVTRGWNDQGGVIWHGLNGDAR